MVVSLCIYFLYQSIIKIDKLKTFKKLFINNISPKIEEKRML